MRERRCRVGERDLAQILVMVGHAELFDDGRVGGAAGLAGHGMIDGERDLFVGRLVGRAAHFAEKNE